MQPVRWTLIVGISLLSSLGCSESDRVVDCGETVAVGMIQGQVHLGVVPARVQLRASSVSGYPARAIATGADSTGVYQLLLPSGEYFLEALVFSYDSNSMERRYHYHDGDAPYSRENRDTLFVAADTTIAADFFLGSAIVGMSFPEEFRGERVYLELYPESCEASSYCSGHVTERSRVAGGGATFRFAAMEPGFYRALVRINDFSPSVPRQSLWLPPTRDPSLAELIRIPRANTVTTGWNYPDQPVTLQGQIRGSWRQFGNFTPQLTLVSEDSSAVISAFYTDGDGGFESRIFHPEPFKILTDIAGSQRWYGGTGFDDASLIDLQPGETSLPIEVIESGLLLDIREPTYQDCWKALVQLVDPQDHRVVRQLEFSGYDGYPFHGISNLDAGTYLLRFLPDCFLHCNWLAQWFDGADSIEDAALLTVPPAGGIETVRIELVEGGRIGGTIRLDETSGAFGTLVYVTSAEDPTAIGVVRPGWSCCDWEVIEIGSLLPTGYILRGLPDGDYKVGVWLWPPSSDPWPPDPPEGTVWYPGTLQWEDATVLTTVGGEELTEIDFDLR